MKGIIQLILILNITCISFAQENFIVPETHVTAMCINYSEFNNKVIDTTHASIHLDSIYATLDNSNRYGYVYDEIQIELDSLNRKKSEFYANDDGDFLQVQYFYDNDGLINEQIVIWADMDLSVGVYGYRVEKIKFIYNSTNEILEMQTFSVLSVNEEILIKRCKFKNEN